MSYLSRQEQEVRDERFAELEVLKTRLVGKVSLWVDDAVALHASTTDVAEKAEVIALRDAMIAELRAVLGI